MIPEVDLTFRFDEDKVTVTSIMQVQWRDYPLESLTLQGNDLNLIAVEINGTRLTPTEYRRTEKGLELFSPPSEPFTLKTVVELEPKENTSCQGLYYAGGTFITHCEPEGFRNITYFLDRPDVLSRFRTTLEAKEGRFPCIVSNGNVVDSHEVEEGFHSYTYVNPHPMPSYLFAVVAGDLTCVCDTFTTKSGREVTIEFYIPEQDVDKIRFARAALI